ncbi:HET-domain-containing protein, partial [Macroventuria anomochaeta]
MRLLRLEDGGLELKNVDSKAPPYAILSHTWGVPEEEVTFGDMMKGADKSKGGYRKLTFCERQAAKDGLQYIWVDTCCIDKASSAELSEAINSMFSWYKNAVRCYVYLSDISIVAPTLGEEDSLRSRLQNCSWFTRGWTLQELIAAEDVTFFDCDWRLIGSKKSLVETISAITGVDSLVLSYCCELHELSVAKRLSWAASRQITRIEDQAYCLLGLLNVNMTLIYGEGGKAFKRLQDELIRKSADGSFFLWFRGMDTGILAPSPSYFHPCGKIVQTHINGISHSWEMTHRGLRLTLPL